MTVSTGRHDKLTLENFFPSQQAQYEKQQHLPGVRDQDRFLVAISFLPGLSLIV
jgi:hypothetical protein